LIDSLDGAPNISPSPSDVKFKNKYKWNPNYRTWIYNRFKEIDNLSWCIYFSDNKTPCFGGTFCPSTSIKKQPIFKKVETIE